MRRRGVSAETIIRNFKAVSKFFWQKKQTGPGNLIRSLFNDQYSSRLSLMGGMP
jgi:hypothetical protein